MEIEQAQEIRIRRLVSQQMVESSVTSRPDARW